MIDRLADLIVTMQACQPCRDHPNHTAAACVRKKDCGCRCNKALPPIVQRALPAPLSADPGDTP